uniref:Uncharacterized protein n=1 Tax=Daucus carota subsp. sativus TaxID=79200 RepID=A0A164X7G8_DAUCS
MECKYLPKFGLEIQVQLLWNGMKEEIKIINIFPNPLNKVQISFSSLHILFPPSEHGLGIVLKITLAEYFLSNTVTNILAFSCNSICKTRMLGGPTGSSFESAVVI